jgi:hypothetical protein
VCTCLVYSLHTKVKGATSHQLQCKRQKFDMFPFVKQTSYGGSIDLTVYKLAYFCHVRLVYQPDQCRAYTPGTARKEADRLLVEFPCTPTRTRAM